MVCTVDQCGLSFATAPNSCDFVLGDAVDAMKPLLEVVVVVVVVPIFVLVLALGDVVAIVVPGSCVL